MNIVARATGPEFLIPLPENQFASSILFPKNAAQTPIITIPIITNRISVTSLYYCIGPVLPGNLVPFTFISLMNGKIQAPAHNQNSARSSAGIQLHAGLSQALQLSRQLSIRFLFVFIFAVFPILVTGACSNPENEIRIQSAVSTTLIHNHETDITFRLLSAGVRRFNLLPAGGHDHNFQLTDEQFALLQLGIPAIITSSINQAHDHTITIQKLE